MSSCALHGVGERDERGRCYACRISGAREALRKARATMACWYDLGDGAGCEAGMFGRPPEVAWGPSDFHLTAASALLDGFTVEEITEAGG